jgi:hypothetical protein
MMMMMMMFVSNKHFVGSVLSLPLFFFTLLYFAHTTAYLLYSLTALSLLSQTHKQTKRNAHSTHSEPFDGVMEGLLTLTSINIPKQGLLHHHRSTSSGSSSTARGSSYADVSATFCHISWDLQQSEHASQVLAMFADLKQQSPLCAGTVYTVNDLYTLARQARAYDAASSSSSIPGTNTSSTTFASTPKQKGHIVVPIPTAVIFHESRCGSTLVSNVFAASKPGQVRTYSEAQAPLQALLACEKAMDNDNHSRYHCDAGAHEQLIRDVFYLLGRLGRKPKQQQQQYVFYKIQSAGTRAMDAFHRAMPHVPWMFVYRNSIEVVMSHLKDVISSSTTTTGGDNESSSKTEGAMCLRTFHDAWQPPALLDLVQVQHGRTMESLSKEEYCAAYLATLGQAAINEYRRQEQHDQDPAQQQQHSSNQRPQQHGGWFINYKDLPFVLWEHVIPELRFMGTPSATDIAQWQSKVTSTYTKGRGGPAKKEEQQRHWQEDSVVKQSRAPESVKRAVALFLDPVYHEMEQIRLAQQPKQH